MQATATGLAGLYASHCSNRAPQSVEPKQGSLITPKLKKPLYLSLVIPYIYTVLAFHIISCMAFFKCTDALKTVIVPLHSEIGLLCVDDSFGECALPSLHNPTLSPTITLQIKEWSYRLEPFKQFLTVLT